MAGDWLEARLHDPGLRIVDCDYPDAYSRVHIAGAIPVQDNYLKDPDSGRLFVMKPEQFAATMAEMGIGDDTEVVAYDGRGHRYAARLWWCLNYYGHKNVRVLDGGWQRWLLERRPLSIDLPRVARAVFTPRVDESLLATREYVLAAMGRPDAVVLDVRSDGEWAGTETRDNKRTGHIPGAVHIEFLKNLTPDEKQSLRPPNELRAMYEAAGVTPDKEVITVCQAGVRAAQAAMILKLLGYERVRNYDGSFAEWGNRDDTPIVG